MVRIQTNASTIIEYGDREGLCTTNRGLFEQALVCYLRYGFGVCMKGQYFLAVQPIYELLFQSLQPAINML